MALEPFALILCLHVAVHHVANSKPYIPPAKQDRTKNVNPCIFVNFYYLQLGFNFSMTRNTNRCLVLVPDSKSRNIPEVILVRRGAVGVLGIWRGGEGWVKGGANRVSLQAT
jgi:hypothetical protein